MARYIDADALKLCIPNTSADIFENCRNCKLLDDYTVIELIDNAPTIDAVPVVRCKDCKYRDPEDKKCDHGGLEHQCVPFAVSDDYFCADGERRENNEV